MKTALVAGGAGFIGSFLCEHLLNKGYKVFAIDSLVTGKRRNIEHLLTNPNFNWIEQDINSPMYMNEGCHEIYNLASPASPVDFDRIPDFILRTGSIGNLNLLDWAKIHKAKFLLASTSEVYGDPLEHPQRETYLGNVDPVGARGCYDEAKRFAEAMTMAYHRKYGIDTKIVRIFNTYGPRMRPEDGRVIPNFFTQALKKQDLTIYGDGKQTRSLCFVTDLVDGIYKLMQSEEHMPVNIGSQNEMTILQLAEEVCRITDRPAKFDFKPLPSRDPKQRRPDITRAKTILQWEPKTSLNEGLKKTFDYFKTSGN